jgi:dienelactone hydrolase
MTETLDQRIAAMAPGYEVHRPPGSGPYPVLIQLHGCGGKKPFQGDWAQVAKAAGWAAVVVDSFRHRGIGSLQAYATVCTGLQLWGRERAGDLFAAMRWVRGQSWADPDCIVAAGWSHGGWTVLDAMALAPGADAEAATRLSGLPEEPLAGLAGAFLVYPFAGPVSVARQRGLRVDAAPFAIAGTNDSIVGGRSLARALQAMPTRGQPIAVEVFEGATHAFDEPGAKDVRVRHDPALTRRAHSLLESYLAASRTRRPVGSAS